MESGGRRYSIGDVASIVGVDAATLRFWERKYQLLHPARSAGGHRLYTEDDIARVRRIKRLAHDEGESLRLVALALDREESAAGSPPADQPAPEVPAQSILVESARDYADRQDQARTIRALLDAAKALNSVVALDPLLAKLVGIVCDLTGADECVLWLLEPDGRRLRPAQAQGVDERALAEAGLPLQLSAEDYPALDQLRKHLIPILIEDATSSSLLPPAFRRYVQSGDIHSALLVPVLRQNKLIGLLSLLLRRSAASFGPFEMALAAGLAEHAGIAIGNARLFEEQRVARRRQEQLARLAAERAGQLQAVLDSIADGVIVVDSEGQVRFVNDAGRRLVRLPATDRPVREQDADYPMCYPDGRPIPPEEMPLARALRGETVVDEQVVFGRPDGTHTYLGNTVSPIKNAQGNVRGAVAVFRDVTARVVAERQATQLADTVREVNERLIVNALAALEAVAHEPGGAEDAQAPSDS